MERLDADLFQDLMLFDGIPRYYFFFPYLLQGKENIMLSVQSRRNCLRKLLIIIRLQHSQSNKAIG